MMCRYMNPIHQQYVERICRSDTFRTTPRLRELLVFLTSDRNPVLKEAVIGVEFFHRDPGYDSKKDPIVRVEVHRLRRRLFDYYNREGSNDPWRIDLPKGAYVPLMRKREEAATSWRLAVLVEAQDDLTAEGLTVELIGKLGELSGLTVMAPRSAFTVHNPEEAMRTLGANAILECRLQGTNLQAKLSRLDSSGLVPMGDFDNVIQPAVEALSRFVASILGSIRQESEQSAKRSFLDRESYRLYLSGRAWFHRWSPNNLAQAAAHFEAVAARCPYYAPAYAGLADIQVLLAYWHVPNARSTLDRGRAYALKAIELDPNCAEAYCSLGALAATIDRDWAASETYFRRALAVNQNNALALNWLSIITLVPQARFEEAFDAVFAAYDLDPASPEIGNEIVWVLVCCRQYHEAADQGRRIVALHPSFLEAYWSLAIAESALGNPSLARGALDTAETLAPDVPFTLSLRCQVEGLAGNVRAAKQYLNRLQKIAEATPIQELYFSWAYAGLDEIDRAMLHLQNAVDRAEPLALYLDVFYPFDRLHSHPHFNEMRKQQHLPAR
jgi:tetratricopeptide (TPR) repeat protein